MEKSALLITDMLNTLDFPEGKQLLPAARRAADRIFVLKQRLKKKGVPTIYVNDNFGDWKSDWKQVFAECSAPSSLGRALALKLQPQPDDYFVLKPKHSGFYLTPLEMLLNELKVKKLIITGIAGNLCVLFTAHDAHMREYKVEVPRDCIASNTKTLNDMALRQLKEVLKINTPLAAGVKV
jgi:nicotinamidase-related amidase